MVEGRVSVAQARVEEWESAVGGRAPALGLGPHWHLHKTESLAVA